jgi:acyl-CoA thioester hydrolase
VNNIYKAGRELAARVESIGGWLSLKERKLVAPPDIIRNAWQQLIRTEDFEELRSSIKK